MTAARRYMTLNAYLRNSGYHETAWRVPPADPASILDPRQYSELARKAERGVLDSISPPDSPTMAEFLPWAGFDPLQLLSSVATAIGQVGLITTAEPAAARAENAGRILREHVGLSRPARPAAPFPRTGDSTMQGGERSKATTAASPAGGP